jgi:hypothetical protein
MKDFREMGKEVQHDPYGYLLSEGEKQSARNVPFRLMFNGAAMGAAAIYFLTKNNQVHRIKYFSISLELVFGLGWRLALSGLVADQMSRRIFVNYEKLRQNQMATNEVKKIMVKFPHAKTLRAPHRKANSWFWV